MKACPACERDDCERCRGGSCVCCGVSTEEDNEMIETEKATDHLDLPHAYNEVSRDQRECVCGRAAGDRLHDAAPITEQAAHSAPLQTEKGT